MTTSDIFPKRLKKLRIKKGFTQKEIGELVGVKQNTFTNWERGTREPSFEKLVELSIVLETTIDYLLGVTDNPLSSDNLTEDKVEKLSEKEIIELAEINKRTTKAMLLNASQEMGISLENIVDVISQTKQEHIFLSNIVKELKQDLNEYQKFIQSGNNSETTDTK
ncbi:TPA: helix-turn-helix transcriptional regulator [Streptococcus suis]|nr:helix-turn-helix transcriptional regulator [Streptococcus suis]HEM3648727.1 helix-turn-helix transcriptional regulator [Streptococcus suis]